MHGIQRLIVVCLGNICRSATAFAFFQSIINQRQLFCVLDSAGIDAMIDSPAEPKIQMILKEEYDLDLSVHRAKQLTDAMILNNDLILVMDSEQQRYLQMRYPFACGKIHTLGKWRGTSIRDPYNESKIIFAQNISLIYSCVNEWAKKLWVEVG